jgi:hypothetical protein
VLRTENSGIKLHEIIHQRKINKIEVKTIKNKKYTMRRRTPDVPFLEGSAQLIVHIVFLMEMNIVPFAYGERRNMAHRWWFSISC